VHEITRHLRALQHRLTVVDHKLTVALHASPAANPSIYRNVSKEAQCLRSGCCLCCLAQNMPAGAGESATSVPNRDGQILSHHGNRRNA
jgi:hypothetical protein